MPKKGIVKRFHKTMLDEFYRIGFRKSGHATVDELQVDLDAWMREFNEPRPHQENDALDRRPCRSSLERCP
ncbi:MAG: integrase core domain-containing protein [Methylocystis sp.]